MSTANATRTAAVPRAMLVGEWLGEAALSISNWLSNRAAQRRALREDDAVRHQAQLHGGAAAPAAIHTPK
jgi:hypothetical protein